MAIDLVMDPVSIRSGAWTWVHGGPYFGVPIGNFVGWFFVTIVATGVFRLFEYYSPRKAPTIASSIALIPVLGYLLIGINFLIGAVSYRLPALAALGLVIVIAPAIANLLLYMRMVRRRREE